MEPDSIDRVFDYVIPYIHTTDDRNSISLVCHKWFQLDCMTRKHVTIHFCYATSPYRLSRRFPYLESLTLKGKPGTAIPPAETFQAVPHDWGGYVTPWIEVIASTDSFRCLKSIRFRRMIVTDLDLDMLAGTLGKQIRVLDINACSGFSTDGLLKLSTNCSNLRTLCLQKSEILEKDGEWLHELALRSTCMESLNFYKTDIDKCDTKDLVLLAKNCSETLISLKLTDCDIRDLVNVFRYAVKLEEFWGAPFYEDGTNIVLKYPSKLRSMAMTYMSRNDIPIVLVFSQQLTELDLTYVVFNDNDHCELVYNCPNLEVLYTKDTIGDFGLQVLGQFCKKLRRVKIKQGDSEEGVVSQLGLTELARGCVKLECLHAYIKDITNEALECIGSNLKNLYDFRITSIGTSEKNTNLPLNNGVRALLRGCIKLEKLGIYLRPPVLTDVGLRYIGKYGQNLRSLMLGFLGEPNDGLLQLSVGCPKLQKFEVMGCYFSEEAISMFAWNLSSLRYMWIQSYRVSNSIFETEMDFTESDGDIFGGDGDIMNMIRPNWNMELIRPEAFVVNEPADSFQLRPFSLLAYYSLVGQRKDFPERVIPLHPPLDDDDEESKMI